MATLRQFSLSMQNLGNRVERRGPEVQRKLALDILRLAIFGTPVGNKDIWLDPGKARIGYVGGRARANWFVGIGSANTTITEDIDSSGNTTLSKGQEAIQAAGKGSPIHLTNNLPYIIPLNNGHSHQAPEGWIESAIQAAVEAASGQRVTEEGR